ncbi:biotin transporter BioY [Chlamydia vaughanii]|uniref:biotin transporter BioY n=1 Tax=Chlamydia vaughanii TaxID=3112552 RepID=UPI0032B10D8D
MSHSLVKRSWVLGIFSNPIIKILEGSIFLTLLAKITLHLPFTPVPVTFQTLGIYCIGVVASPMIAVGSVVAYLLEGLFLPVFYSSGYGIAAFFGPTAGYLYAFPIAAALISVLYRHFKESTYALAVILTAAAALITTCGSIWLACYLYLTSVTSTLDIVTGFKLGAAPFVIGETLKILLVIHGRTAGEFFKKRYF